MQSEIEEKKVKLNEANDAYLLLTDMSESRRQKKKLADVIENISVPFYDLAESLGSNHFHILIICFFKRIFFDL